MQAPDAPVSDPAAPSALPPQPLRSYPPTPITWRMAIAATVLVLGLAAYVLRETIGPRGQACAGVFCFFGLVAMFSSNLRAVNWKTIGWGVVLQVILALLVLKAQVEINREGSTLSVTSIRDTPLLAAKLKNGTNGVPTYLNSRLSTETRQAMGDDRLAKADLSKLQDSLVKDLNKVIAGESIYQPERFAGVALRTETSELLARSPQGADLAHLNRLLLDDAFPTEISRTQIYSVAALLNATKVIVVSFIEFSDAGARFVFGNLAVPGDIALNPGKEFLFIFAFKALPPILFVSAFFTVLYHFGILQWCVRMMAVVMVRLMGTSGAETLSVSANVFMGQTEAPLIVKPYVPRMTNSELFALMASGMAHISGGMMVVYINYGADPVAVLTTCIMACPCSLYLAKLFLPELAQPETAGTVQTKQGKSPYVNAIDAAAAGTGDGLKLAFNVAAMLIVFIAFVAMFDALLGLVSKDLSLQKVFSWMFSPAAFLMGVEAADIGKVGTLLGAKLSINEHYAYLLMKGWKAATPDYMSARSYQLTAFALTGFANFASVGIQLGGIGALAPERRHDLARLGLKALFVGFTATLLNAAIAGILLP